METSTISIDLQKIPVLSDIPPARLEVWARRMIRRTYAPGEVIFLEGEASAGMWFIVEGRVRIIKQSLHGRTQALCMASAGKCFGGCPLFDDDSNPATAQALDDVTLLILPRDSLNQMVYEDSDLAATLFQVFSRRFTHLARLSEGLGAWTVSTRINDCLLLYADWDETTPSFNITHEKLASLAGTVREVVTRHLSKLETQGTIQLEANRILLLKPEDLSQRCVTGNH